jgi:purine-binding chemotaxis protein CheW
VRKPVAAAPSVQFVAFRVGTAELAVEVFAVQEILRRQPVVEVPQAPAFVDGVLELRGALIPVVDLRRRLGVKSPREDAATRVIIARAGEEVIGLVVDSVTEVLRVPETALSEPPQYVRDVAAEYVQGIARLKDRLLVVIDLQRVLSAGEIGQLAELERAIRQGQAEDQKAAHEAAPAGAEDHV